MKVFRVNGKEYTTKAFDFNMICDLEDMGVSLEDAKDKPMSMVRAYFAICTGKGKVFAGEEMEKHIVNGGSFEELLNVMGEEMEKSDFFRSLNKTEEPAAIEGAGKAKKK
ncbi:MAG: hypothetical protein J6Q48_10550 [Bacteroidaceae bacterium]|nr:hypothetical protein [Bacteroidaceae bacterium]